MIQCQLFDAKPNLNTNPMHIRFGQMTLWTNELSLVSTTLERVVQCE